MAELSLNDHESTELSIAAKTMHRKPWHDAKADKPDTRLERAEALIRQGRVALSSARDLAQVVGEEGTYLVNRQGCSCPNSAEGHKVCYHTVAVKLYKEWKLRLDPLAPASPTTPEAPPVIPEEEGPIPSTEEVPVSEPSPPVMIVPPRPSIPREHLVTIQGRSHVLYTGLLSMAQEAGLTSLTAEWTYNDESLSLAKAVAVFSDGRQYTEAGDASPANVNKRLAPHFRRISLTRAKARCLRDALAISDCAVEELDSDPQEDAPGLPMGQYKHHIWKWVLTQAPEGLTKEATAALIHRTTGLELVEDNYAAIVAALRAQAQGAA